MNVQTRQFKQIQKGSAKMKYYNCLPSLYGMKMKLIICVLLLLLKSFQIVVMASAHPVLMKYLSCSLDMQTYWIKRQASYLH